MRAHIVIVPLLLDLGCGDTAPRSASVGTKTATTASTQSRVDSKTRMALSHFVPASPMADLAGRFLAARPVRATELSNGSWILTDQVRTQAFRTGGTGPDEVHSDSAGLRTDSTKPFSLIVEFKLDSTGKLRVSQKWGDGELDSHSVATYGLDSTLVFSLNVGADEDIRTFCRAQSDTQLVCLDLEHIGDGMVLRRVPRAIIVKPSLNDH